MPTFPGPRPKFLPEDFSEKAEKGFARTLPRAGVIPRLSLSMLLATARRHQAPQQLFPHEHQYPLVSRRAGSLSHAAQLVGLKTYTR